jgi:hypothetical protein
MPELFSRIQAQLRMALMPSWQSLRSNRLPQGSEIDLWTLSFLRPWEDNPAIESLRRTCLNARWRLEWTS